MPRGNTQAASGSAGEVSQGGVLVDDIEQRGGPPDDMHGAPHEPQYGALRDRAWLTASHLWGGMSLPCDATPEGDGADSGRLAASTRNATYSTNLG